MATETAQNYLSAITYNNLVVHNREMLVSSYWATEFIELPRVCYFPGTEFIKTQTRSVSGIEEPQPSTLDFSIRGYSSYQLGNTTVPISSVTVEFIDYEDSSILYYLRDWRDKQSDWSKFVANRLVNCVGEMKVYRLNKESKVVRTYYLKRMVLDNIQYPDAFDEDPSLVGDRVSGTWKCLALQSMENTKIVKTVQ